MRTSIIIGIDPGTTSAYAILSLQGKLLHLHSSKNLDLNEITKQITDKGKPILIATDKPILPHFVKDVATKLGATIYAPKEDMKKIDKRAITKSFLFSNDHEMDALAAAIMAWKQYRNLYQRIDKVLHKEEKFHFTNQVKAYITKFPEANIKLALDIIESNEKSTTNRMQRVVEKKQTPEDIQYLYTQIQDRERENFLLKEEKRGLVEEMKQAQLQQNRMRKVIAQFDKKTKRDTTVRSLQVERKSLRKKITRLKKQKSSLVLSTRKIENILINFDDFIIVKKLSTLGAVPLDHIYQHDILLIDDPAHISHNTIATLQNLVQIMIVKKTPSRKLQNMLHFHFIPAQTLQIFEFSRCAIIHKNQYLQEKAKLDILDIALREFIDERGY